MQPKEIDKFYRYGFREDSKYISLSEKIINIINKINMVDNKEIEIIPTPPTSGTTETIIDEWEGYDNQKSEDL